MMLNEWCSSQLSDLASCYDTAAVVTTNSHHSCHVCIQSNWSITYTSTVF